MRTATTITTRFVSTGLETWTFLSDGAYLGATAGWLAHLGSFEIGPLLVLDGSAGERGFVYVTTLNLALGFAPE